MEPKIVSMGNDKDYYAVKLGREHLEGILHKYAGVDKNQLSWLINDLEVEKNRIPANKLNAYGMRVLKGSKIGKGTVVDGKALVESLENLFKKAITYAQVYRAPYILIQKLNVYQTEDDGQRVYGISGVAQLLRKI